MDNKKERLETKINELKAIKEATSLKIDILKKMKKTGVGEKIIILTERLESIDGKIELTLKKIEAIKIKDSE